MKKSLSRNETVVPISRHRTSITSDVGTWVPKFTSRTESENSSTTTCGGTDWGQVKYDALPDPLFDSTFKTIKSEE